MKTIHLLLALSLAFGLAEYPCAAGVPAPKAASAAATRPNEQLIGVVYFVKNVATVDKRYKSVMQYIVKTLKSKPALCIRIQGFADASERDPLELASRRTQTVVAELKRNGIEPSRITSLAAQVRQTKRVKERIRNQKTDLVLIGTL